MRRAARPLPLPLLLLLLQCGRCSEGAGEGAGESESAGVGDGERLAPWFVWEPASVVRYEARAGVAVRCAARGHPPPDLRWLDADGAPLTDRPPYRRVYENGTLVVSGGADGDGGETVVVRCRADNVHGAALSREVRLQPVEDARWEPALNVAPATAGGVAALVCRSTGATAAGDVRPELWYKDDRLLVLDPPSPEARLLAAGDVLLVGEAGAGDAGRYACVARHTLTRSTKRAAPATLTVTSAGGAVGAGTAPRLVTAGAEVAVPAGTDFCLPCASGDHPPPHYTWYREWNGRLQPVGATGATGVDGMWLWRGGAALCMRGARRELSGAWLCKAYNVFGEATAQLRLTVSSPLSVRVSPAVVVAPAGATVRLACAASDVDARLAWTHDAAAAGAGALLVLRDLTRHHRGLYQCFARRGTDSAHASAEVRLGESPPELQYTFIEQAVRAGSDLSLRCAASGAPAPRFLWLLDGAPLDAHRSAPRLALAETPAPSVGAGDVLALLNITAVTPADGGRYTCRAHNRLGHAEHSARLNIYGPPSVRAVGLVRVVAGANATIYCPYAGYPISSISWRRGRGGGGGGAVGGGGERVSARGAALRLAPALAQDAGPYACTVAAPDGPAATQDIEIQVRNPPKISPFMFSSELTEGSSVQVLCGVSSGDKPMYFSWLKDGEPLPPNLQIEEKSLNEFSLLMFSELSARHSGAYTCRVSNHAAVVNYTATLDVKVAPVWVTEPLDAAVLLGAPVLLECAAKGYPPPTITWHRKIAGDGDSVRGESEQWEQVAEGWGAPGEGEEEGALVARGGALVARAAARAHRAIYRCTADNGVGPPLVKQLNLTVHEPAHFEETGGEVSGVRGRGVALACLARGDAPLAVHWSRAGTRVDLTSYRWMVSEVRTAGGLRSTLQLRAAEKTDAGEYRCHAHNQYGRSEILLYLHVEEPPAAPGGVQLGGVSTRWVRVIWRTPATPAPLAYSARLTPLRAHPAPAAPADPLLYNLTLEPASPDADGVNVLASRIEGLRPAATYSLRLAATNHVGPSPHSDPLMFTTLEEVPAAAPQNVRVRSGNPGELHLSWSAPSQDSWNGEVLGYVARWREVGGEGAAGGGRATAPGWSSAELQVSGLRGATGYAVTLRAYNRAGAGPAAPVLYATTAEGVPETTPAAVSCEALSPRTMRVRWTPTNRTPSIRGYDVHYVPVHIKPERVGEEARTVRGEAGVGSEATLQALRPHTNYSVWVRARSDVGLGPPAHLTGCFTHDDVPGAVEVVRALAAGESAVRVTWLAPAPRAAPLTHYTLYTRELGKAGGSWSQRVEVGDGEEEEEEVWRDVRGLRPAVYEVWVRAHAAAGAGPASRPLTAAPAQPVSARISSLGRVVYARRGATVRLRCAAVGTPPLRGRWSPLPTAHTLTDSRDLILHKVDSQFGGNYTCSVRNAGGSDSVVMTVVVVSPPAPPTPRLVRATAHALHLAWDAPPAAPAAPAPLLGYTVEWARDENAGARAVERGEARLPAGATTLVVRRLACGAPYRLTVRAENAVGASPVLRPLLARTKGDKVKAAPGKEFVWANSTTLRLNLLTWRSRCAVPAWRVALRRADTALWRHLPDDGETAEANDLNPGTRYEVSVVASSPAGDTAALYRAATLTRAGERLGEAVEVPSERGAGAGAAGGPAGDRWRFGAVLELGGAALAALLGALTVAALHRRYLRWRRRCDARAGPRHLCPPHPQLYSTEPGKRNGKTLTPPAPAPATPLSDGGLHEISPYATFSMVGGAGGAGGAEGVAPCALHLHTFARAEALDLAVPPPRPNLLAQHAHAHAEYGRSRSRSRSGCRDSDSESSGSPCAACNADLYRLPAVAAGSLPAVAADSSAEDTSCSAGSRARAAARLPPLVGPAPRTRRDRHPPTGRSPEATATASRGALRVARGAPPSLHNS